MKIETALTELKGVRVAIAFPPPAWVTPGVGDVLLAGLQPHFPTLPILLVSVQHHGVQAHAAFQAQALVEGDAVPDHLRRLRRVTIDLALPPALPDEALPF